MKEKSKEYEKKLTNLTNLRGHKIINSSFKTKESSLTLYCFKHNKTFITTLCNYERAKFGTSCCASESSKKKISKALKNKPKKYTSWLKGKKGKNHPAYKHGLGNTRAANPNELDKLKNWKKSVLHNYNYKCFITGLKNTPKTPLVVHHLESWDINKKLRYDINNGVVLLKTIHKNFHNLYGFGNNTTLQFEIYCIEKYNIKNFPWKYGNHEPSFILNTEKLKEKKEKEFYNLCNSRNHKKINGFYEKFNSTVEILCLTHNKITKTTYHNYKKK